VAEVYYRSELRLQRIHGLVHCVRVSHGLAQVEGVGYVKFDVTLCRCRVEPDTVDETWDTAKDWAPYVVISCISCQVKFERAK
jgi:hypothetical protein